MQFSPNLSEHSLKSQNAFRALMNAMAQPGTFQKLAPDLHVPSPLQPVSAALLIALSDFETTIWLDQSLADATEVGEFLRFHTGSKLVSNPAEADFGVVAAQHAMPALSAFAQGTLEYPDRSTTVVIQVDTLRTSGWQLSGPGIRDINRFAAGPLPDDFVAQLNARAFPCGVDVVFVAGDEIAALPRSTRVSEDG
jgi:alpha-D-ribose 1-methylphosphonate 5-triphosphate synthase subunit PhnH